MGTHASSHGAILLVVAVLAIFLSGRILPLSWAGRSGAQLNFETWASQSRLRTFGVPFLVAAVSFALAWAFGFASSLAHIYADAFVLFILFAVVCSGSKVAKIRLGVQMLFMTVFFGCVMALYFIFSGHLSMTPG